MHTCLGSFHILYRIKDPLLVLKQEVGVQKSEYCGTSRAIKAIDSLVCVPCPTSMLTFSPWEWSIYYQVFNSVPAVRISFLGLGSHTLVLIPSRATPLRHPSLDALCFVFLAPLCYHTSAGGKPIAPLPQPVPQDFQGE